MTAISKFIVFIIYLFLVNECNLAQDVSFLIYRHEKCGGSTEIESEQISCQQSCRVDKSTEVFFVIHGWLQSVNEPYVRDIRKLLFRRKREEALIIEVDWFKYAREEYDVARSFNEVVAKAIQDLLLRLMKDYNIRPQHVEIIGHCMGCHIAGIVGKNMLAATGKKIGRITALDPAGPAYSNLHESKRLGPNDAEVVFVVHTDAYVFGYGDKCGTVDFYPNGGRDPQPGCLGEHGVVEYDLCSHQRSIIFYLESLNCSRFCGIQCSSYESYLLGLCSTNRRVDFSDKLNKKHSGTYFTATNSKKPFLKR